MTDGTFGIDIRHYCRDHEAHIRSAAPTPDLLEDHLEKIRWIQHERLVHLIVTVMVVFVELSVTGLVLIHPDATGLLGPVVAIGLAILLGFYFYHYFFLENATQRWYLLADEMRTQLGPQRLAPQQPGPQQPQKPSTYPPAPPADQNTSTLAAQTPSQ